MKSLTKNITLVIFTLSIFFTSSAFTPNQNISATCPIGYAKNNAGVCVVVTNQRPVVSQASKKASAYALCLTNTPNWTPAKQKSCMRAKGYK